MASTIWPRQFGDNLAIESPASAGHRIRAEGSEVSKLSEMQETAQRAVARYQDAQLRLDESVAMYIGMLQDEVTRLRGEVTKFRTEVKRVSKAQRLTKLELKELKQKYDEAGEAARDVVSAAYQSGFYNGVSERKLAAEIASDAISDPPF
jgi:hypothetical protein